MDTFLKATVITVLAVILSVSLSKQAKDFSAIISLSACICMMFVIIEFISPIISTIQDLSEIAKIDNALLETLLKTVGVAILSEFMVQVCNDSGHSALGKGIQMLGSVVILWLSLPLFTTLMDVVKEIMLCT